MHSQHAIRRSLAPVQLTCLLAATGILSACLQPAAEESDELAAEESSQIINGSSVQNNPSGVVAFWRWNGSAPFCSGVLLTNEWVLTAGSCFSDADADVPTNMTVTMKGVAGFTSPREIIRKQDRNVALVRLLDPRPMNGSTSGYQRAVMPSSPIGQAVRCAGYGANSGASGGGTLREGYFVLQAGPDGTVTISKNVSGQLPSTSGDVGSPCFVSQAGGEAIVGVLSGCSGSTCSYDNTGGYQSWIVTTQRSHEIMPRHSGKCVETMNAAFGLNSVVEQHDCSGERSQQWRLEYVSAGTSTVFRIRDTEAGRCLAISGSSEVITAACSQSSLHQRFYLTDGQAGFQTIRSIYNDKCLDMPLPDPGNGARLQQFTCNGGTNQQFRLRTHFEGGSKTIRSGLQCLNVPAIGVGTNLDVAACNGGAAQRFLFDEVALGVHRILPTLVAGQCLDVENGTNNNGEILQQFTCLPQDNQRFEFFWRNPGTFHIRVRNSGKCVETVPGQTFLQQFTCDEFYAQHFTL